VGYHVNSFEHLRRDHRANQAVEHLSAVFNVTNCFFFLELRGLH
ncbi:hypothetical protein Y032_0196g1511, partial [Ancylostoma ceylanicum]